MLCKYRDMLLYSIACCTYAVRHDVCLSVTLSDYDRIMQQKVEIAHDRIGWCLGYQNVVTDPDCK